MKVHVNSVSHPKHTLSSVLSEKNGTCLDARRSDQETMDASAGYLPPAWGLHGTEVSWIRNGRGHVALADLHDHSCHHHPRQ